MCVCTLSLEDTLNSPRLLTDQARSFSPHFLSVVSCLGYTLSLSFFFFSFSFLCLFDLLSPTRSLQTLFLFFLFFIFSLILLQVMTLFSLIGRTKEKRTFRLLCHCLLFIKTNILFGGVMWEMSCAEEKSPDQGPLLPASCPPC